MLASKLFFSLGMFALMNSANQAFVSTERLYEYHISYAAIKVNE